MAFSTGVCAEAWVKAFMADPSIGDLYLRHLTDLFEWQNAKIEGSEKGMRLTVLGADNTQEIWFVPFELMTVIMSLVMALKICAEELHKKGVGK